MLDSTFNLVLNLIEQQRKDELNFVNHCLEHSTPVQQSTQTDETEQTFRDMQFSNFKTNKFND